MLLSQTFLLYNGISFNPTSAFVVNPLINPLLRLLKRVCLFNSPIFPPVIVYTGLFTFANWLYDQPIIPQILCSQSFSTIPYDSKATPH